MCSAGSRGTVKENAERILLYGLRKRKGETGSCSDVEADVNVADAVDEVMKKYDRESNTRIWEGKPKLVVKTIMALFPCTVSS